MKNKNRIHIILLLIILVIVIFCLLTYFIKNKANKEIIKPTYSVYEKGDITGDGEIEISDVSKLYRAVKGIITLTNEEKEAGDVITDGNISINDVSRLYRYCKGAISELVISPTSNVTSLSYISQLEYTNLYYCKTWTYASAGCGPTSFAMVARAYSKQYLSYSNDDIIKEVRNFFCSLDKNNEKDNPTHSSLFVDSRVLEHFGLKAEILFRYEYDGFWSNTMKQDEADKIFNAIKNEGKSVLLAMPGHWSAVGPNPECKSDEVYFYNPSSSSQTKCYTMQGLYNVTYNHKGTCGTSGGMCGWAVAIAVWS